MGIGKLNEILKSRCQGLTMLRLNQLQPNERCRRWDVKTRHRPILEWTPLPGLSIIHLPLESKVDSSFMTQSH